MTITATALFPPLPATLRAHAAQLAFDTRTGRVAYPSGKTVVVRPLGAADATSTIQFTGHNSTTTAVSFAPSGNYVASGDANGNVKIWSAEKLSDSFEQPPVKSEFQVLLGPVRSISWDADGTRIIAVGEGKEKFGHCFSWDSGNSIGDIQGHAATVNAVDIRKQRPYRAATVSDDKAMVFFTGPPFKFDKSVRGHHTNSIQGVKFSPDGAHLVSVGSDRQIVLYDGKTGEYVKAVSAHNGGIYGVAWKSDTQFVTASADNTIKTWDTSLQNLHTIEMPATKPVSQQLAVCASDNLVVTVLANGSINLLDGDAVSTIFGHQGQITALATGAAEDSGLLSAASDGSIVRWEGSKAVPAGSHSGYVCLVVLDSGHYYTAGWDDTVRKWKQGELVAEAKLEGQPKQLLLAEKLTVVFESKVETYGLDLQLEGTKTLDFATNGGDLLPQGLILTTPNAVQNIDTGKELQSLRAAPTLVKVSPNGEYIAVADSTGKFTLYDQEFAVVTTRWAFHSSRVLGALWSPDSKYLASGGLDSSIFVYSVDKPSKVQKCPLAHQNGVTAVQWTEFGSENATLVSGGADGAVKTWRVEW